MITSCYIKKINCIVKNLQLQSTGAHLPAGGGSRMLNSVWLIIRELNIWFTTLNKVHNPKLITWTGALVDIGGFWIGSYWRN